MKRILSLLLTITVVLSAFSFVVPVYASDETEPFIDYIYYNDFTTVNDAAKYRYSASNNISNMTSIYNSTTETFATGFEHTVDGTMKITHSTDKYSGLVINGMDVNGNIPKLIVSYRIKPKFAVNDAYYYATLQDQNGTSNIALYNKTNGGAGRGIYSGITYNRTWDSANKLLDVSSFDGNTWYDVTFIYDNDSNKINNRDIYINGVYEGTYASHTTSSAYNYSVTGKVDIRNYFNSRSGDYIEFDDFKAYAYPSELKYELESATSEEVKINFNMIPDSATVVPANFTVKSGNTTITPATATLSTKDARQVILTFSEDLQPGTLYTVSATDITAGSSATDVADTLSIASSPELSFKVAPPKVEWTATSNVYNFNYENLSASDNVAASNSDNGFYTLTNGLFNIETNGAEKFFTLQQNSTNAATAGISIRSYNLAPNNSYAFEIKLKTDFSKNPENAMFDIREQAGYGLPFTALNNGVIYAKRDLQESIGTYTDGEWITLKNVYYSSPVNIDGTEYLRRDIYINGQFVKTQYENSTFINYINGTSNWVSTFRLIDKYNAINTEGKVYIDYIRVYKTVDAFASKLTESSNIDTDFINVQFNNIPVETDLTDKIYIADENGNKVSDIAVCEFVNEFNADGYAAKVNLWFVNELEFGKTYKLCIDGVSDIKGNILYQEENFTTKSLPEAEGLTISDGIATVTVNEYSEPLTLIVAGYEVVDGVEQMTTVTEKEITSVGTFSTETTVTGDVVKAFLWKGTKPVITSVSK